MGLGDSMYIVKQLLTVVTFFALSAGFTGSAFASGGADSAHIVYAKQDRDKEKSNKTGELSEAAIAPRQVRLDMGKTLEIIEEQHRMDEIRRILSEDKRSRAVDQYMEKSVPLRPNEIRRLRYLAKEAQKATQRPIGKAPKPIIRTQDLDINDPNPTVVFVSSGYATSLVYFDQSGAPWPVESVVIGDETSFASSIIGEMQNIITINPLRAFGQGNMLVNLRELPVPLVVTLSGSDEQVHARLNLRIPRSGPNAKIETIVENNMSSAPDELLDILDGKAPPLAVRHELKGIDGDVWEVDGDIYVRTDGMLISPAWKRSVSSATGLRVYKLGMVSELLFSINGKTVKASVGEATQHYLHTNK